ncbi:Beta-glucan synthesis-associated protein SKN1 [Psilocybe cubensis]|uniref:Beta-glucan synthesis-associated protein SKN1 n=1 Tax=Psilocybe cubensis TaxID=181762 RepID=A0ACB8GS22_PSICU|nr:Beta-glucan synthesis-associated protein SKN1 [Psilocybe cubensis]KAH9478433.1 Beta-glucan synthesis-associated protein SKN1 [Psilocybe cubensis]
MSRAPFGGQNHSAQNLLPTAGRPNVNAPRSNPPPVINQFSRQAKRNSSSTTHSSPSESNHGRFSTGHPFSLSPAPSQWGTPLLMNASEPDDYLHNPDPRRDRKNDSGGSIFTARGLANLGCLTLLAVGCYPIITHYTEKKQTTQGGFNLGGTNASGQVPELPGNYGLIDKDTPKEAYTWPSYIDGEDLVLVFSDEFNRDGRTFYPGEDPFWEAVDLHYWGTKNLEWYDPSQATTKGGNLELRMDLTPDRSVNHNMLYKSGMIQTWNKFCFTGGLLITNVQLPGSSDVSGFWPAVWSMGNLGRAGYGASLEGLWPYSYDECDVGTLPNQTYPGERRPLAAVTNGDPEVGGELSYLPGQRLSACTCPGESHPGPMRKDGSYVGRAAPEIDVIEATVTEGIGHVSLSAQWAPFNARYQFLNQNTSASFDDPRRTVLNSYQGGRYQQTTSGLSLTNPNCYEIPGTCFALYGFEYKPGFDDAYITWINEVRAWTIRSEALLPDTEVEIGRRLVPVEPMYLIANLGISEGFGEIDVGLQLPAIMKVDYIRVYQRKDEINVGCDPKDFPTAKYIETYKEAYTNPNLTVWADYKQPWPKNRMDPGGCT